MCILIYLDYEEFIFGKAPKVLVWIRYQVNSDHASMSTVLTHRSVFFIVLHARQWVT